MTADMVGLETMPTLPSVEDIMTALHSSREGRSLRRGAENFHMRMCNFGLESDANVSKHLLLMYVDCKSLSDAKQVFDKLPHRTQDHWSFLIQAYVESDASEHAFMLFLDMQRLCIVPNAHTYVALLRSCAKLRSIDRGRELHAHLVQHGLEKDLFIGSVLVDMYSNCSLLNEAHDVFNELPNRNVVTWTALLAGYAERGLDEDVLYLLEQMQLEGIPPNPVTFAYILKACNSRFFDRGQRVHARILKGGLEGDNIISNSLMIMYAKHGLLEEANNVFMQLPVRNVVMWTTLMVAYSDCGLQEKAFECLDEMKLDGVCPDCVAFVCGIKACSNIGSISRGRELHAEIVREGHDLDLRIGNSIMDMYAKFGLVAEAREVLEELRIRNSSFHKVDSKPNKQDLPPDVVSWTAVILGYAEDENLEEAIRLFASMQEQGLLPNFVTFVIILKACGKTSALRAGRVFHAQSSTVCQINSTPQVILATSVVDMYSKCGSMPDAQQVFDAMSLTGDHVAWNALLSGYACQGEKECVMKLVKRMRLEGLQLDEAVILNLLTVCSHCGLIDSAWESLELIMTSFPTVDQFNCIIDLLCRSGCLIEAFFLVEAAVIPSNSVTWSIILSACQNWADMELGLQASRALVP